ncbi:hypothetical protein D918_04676 [Trichuris suis]|nr:hypothetical protein D918_04676 [Trichuris suis]
MSHQLQKIVRLREGAAHGKLRQLQRATEGYFNETLFARNMCSVYFRAVFHYTDNTVSVPYPMHDKCIKETVSPGKVCSLIFDLENFLQNCKMTELLNGDGPLYIADYLILRIESDGKFQTITNLVNYCSYHKGKSALNMYSSDSDDHPTATLTIWEDFGGITE